jgi:transcriptional regulator with GAF, ATPase, and Fis domain
MARFYSKPFAWLWVAGSDTAIGRGFDRGYAVEYFKRPRFGDRDDRNRQFDQIVGNSAPLEAVLEKVERVAPTSSTVLVQGETGTGKELIAKAIHNISPRYDHPFVKVNCAAIPLDLLESELFGHEKGAFTGAIAQKVGRFELADKGTLFLDEVGDIPLPLQPKLLRVLQEYEFERLGSARTHRIDVRVVAATHRDLEQMVNRGEFRSDLYYRLNVFPVWLPPLRARQEDISPLVTHFVDFYGRQIGKPIEHVTEETMAALISYPWPGNVRELQNLIERAVILSRDGVLANPLPSNRQEAVTVISNSTTLKEVDRALILQALEGARWMIGGPEGAAAKLGLKRTTLLYKMKKLGIVRPVRGQSAPVEALDHPVGVHVSHTPHHTAACLR